MDIGRDIAPLRLVSYYGSLAQLHSAEEVVRAGGFS